MVVAFSAILRKIVELRDHAFEKAPEWQSTQPASTNLIQGPVSLLLRIRFPGGVPGRDGLGRHPPLSVFLRAAHYGSWELSAESASAAVSSRKITATIPNALSTPQILMLSFMTNEFPLRSLGATR